MLNLDKQGRVSYTPKYHFKHKKMLTEMEIAYICKFYEHDGARSISFALGRTELSIAKRYNELKNTGMIDHYKKIWDKQFEEVP